MKHFSLVIYMEFLFVESDRIQQANDNCGSNRYFNFVHNDTSERECRRGNLYSWATCTYWQTWPVLELKECFNISRTCCQYLPCLQMSTKVTKTSSHDQKILLGVIMFSMFYVWYPKRGKHRYGLPLCMQTSHEKTDFFGFFTADLTMTISSAQFTPWNFQALISKSWT